MKFNFELDFNPHSMESLHEISHVFGYFYQIKETESGLLKKFTEKAIIPIEKYLRTTLGDANFYKIIRHLDYVRNTQINKVNAYRKELYASVEKIKPANKAPEDIL